MKQFLFNYQKICLRSQSLFYAVKMSETFLLGLVLLFIYSRFNNSQEEIFEWFILIVFFSLSATMPYKLVGGYEVIKNKFLKKHGLVETDLK